MVDIVPLLDCRDDTPEIRDVLRLLGPETHSSFEPDEYYRSYPGAGISILFKSNVVKAVFLYSDGVEGYWEWPLGLPRGLAFDMSQTSIRERLGEPSRNGEYKGRVWDRYDADTHSVHIHYFETRDRIRVLSLVSASERARIDAL